MLKSHTKSASQEDLGGSADCNEAICGSSKPSEGTLEKVSTNQKSPVTKVDGGGANNVSSDTHVPKGNDLSRDNKIGRVDISSIVEFPIGDAGNNEKSFSVVSAPKVYFLNAFLISIDIELFFFSSYFDCLSLGGGLGDSCNISYHKF